MAKQKGLPFERFHMEGFLTRKRDDSFSPASLSRAMSRGRGTEMSVGLWLVIMVPFSRFLEWEYRVKPISIDREGKLKRHSA
jgi:hypothetical protein